MLLITLYSLNLAGGLVLLVTSLLALFKPGVWIRWLADYNHDSRLTEENEAVVWFFAFYWGVPAWF